MFASILSLWLATLVCMPSFAYAVPKVIATIKPLHSIASTVMEGVGTPDLLIQGKKSPHDYALKPSDARRLQEAELIFLVSREFETYLEKPIIARSKTSEFIELLVEKNGIRIGRMPPGEKHNATIDPHFWLDPQNAIAIARVMADKLGMRDAPNRLAYERNAKRFIDSLTVLDAGNKKRFERYAGKRPPYIFYHNAYGYFESRNSLQPALYLTDHPESALTPVRVEKAFEKAAHDNLRCIIAEPAFKTPIIDKLQAVSKASIVEFDPEGSGYAAGPAMYVQMMTELSKTLEACWEQSDVRP